MHADAHHLRRDFTLGVQRVEAVAQVDEEVVGLRKALRQREAHVVGVQRVGHDQLRHHGAVGLLDLHPERQVIAVVVAVVLEAAEVGHQPARVGAVAAGVPAQRPLAGELLDDLHADAHVLAFRRLVDALVADPAPAVAGDLVAQLLERRGRLRIALQGHRNAEHGQRQATLLELAKDAPDTGARAVFIDAFHARMAIRVRRRVEHLRQELFRSGVAVQHRVLAAFLVVEDELQCDPRLARPLRSGRIAAVAGHVARVGIGAVVVHRDRSFRQGPGPRRGWAPCGPARGFPRRVAGARSSAARRAPRRARPALSRSACALPANVRRRWRSGT